MQRILLLFVASFFLVLIHSQTCSWAAWSEWSTCSDTCGSCGSQTRTRVCTGASATCACSGNSTEGQQCNDYVCIFPRASCCSGAPASVGGLFKCA